MKRMKYSQSHELVSQSKRSQFVRLPDQKITVRETSQGEPGGTPDRARPSGVVRNARRFPRKRDNTAGSLADVWRTQRWR